MAKRDRDDKSSSSGNEKSGSKTGGTPSSGNRNTSSGTTQRSDPFYAPDPVVTASRNNGSGWSNSGTAESLSPTTGGGGDGKETLHRAVAVTPADPDRGVPAQPAPVPEPAKHKRAPSGLSLSSLTEPDRGQPARVNKPDPKPDPKKQSRPDPRKDRTATKNTSKPEPAKSPQVRDQQMCKSRPTENKPKGGGGSGKSFVPWKGTKFGC
jgi:hypothetical protein